MVEVLDDETSELFAKAITLGSSAGSVLVLRLHERTRAANASFLDEGFTFRQCSDRSYTMTFTPTGGRTVTFSSASVTQAFGGPVSASVSNSNMDGLTFESMEDVLTELGAQFGRWNSGGRYMLSGR